MDISPEYHDIAEKSRITIHPEEDLRLEVEMSGLDLDATDLELHYTPMNWPANTATFDQPPEGAWKKSGGSYFTVDGSQVKMKVPNDQIQNWRGHTIEVTLIADDGSDRWVIVETTVTLAQGV